MLILYHTNLEIFLLIHELFNKKNLFRYLYFSIIHYAYIIHHCLSEQSKMNIYTANVYLSSIFHIFTMLTLYTSLSEQSKMNIYTANEYLSYNFNIFTKFKIKLKLSVLLFYFMFISATHTVHLSKTKAVL